MFLMCTMRPCHPLTMVPSLQHELYKMRTWRLIEFTMNTFVVVTVRVFTPGLSQSVYEECQYQVLAPKL
jgi:hypothetical protein